MFLMFFPPLCLMMQIMIVKIQESQQGPIGQKAGFLWERELLTGVSLVWIYLGRMREFAWRTGSGLVQPHGAKVPSYTFYAINVQ